MLPQILIKYDFHRHTHTEVRWQQLKGKEHRWDTGRANDGDGDGDDHNNSSSLNLLAQFYGLETYLKVSKDNLILFCGNNYYPSFIGEKNGEQRG